MLGIQINGVGKQAENVVSSILYPLHLYHISVYQIPLYPVSLMSVSLIVSCLCVSWQREEDVATPRLTVV